MLDYKEQLTNAVSTQWQYHQHQLPRPETAKYYRKDNEITNELRENVKYHT